MKKILFSTAALALMGALSGCVGYPGYSSGAWAGYDGSFDDGYHGYQRPITWNNYNPAVYAPVSYAPPPRGYQAAPGYPAYASGPKNGGWYATYYCPPQMGGN